MGTQLPQKGAQQPPLFGPWLLWPNGWMRVKMPLGTEIGLGPGHIVLDGTQSPPQKTRNSPDEIAIMNFFYYNFDHFYAVRPGSNRIP